MAEDRADKDDERPRPLAAEPGSDARPKGDDVVVIHGRTSDGSGLGVSRLRQGRIEHGVVQPLREGKPIMGEVVRLLPRRECPVVCDVEVDVSREQLGGASEARAQASEQEVERSAPRQAHGPAQVATEEYRKNWDVIWAGRKKASQPS